MDNHRYYSWITRGNDAFTDRVLVLDDANFDTVFYLIDITNTAEELDHWIAHLGDLLRLACPGQLQDLVILVNKM